MPRYFLELSYNGLSYSGFQIQKNARSVQGEVEKAFLVYFRKPVGMTGSSRTDSGVHALQNFFHFDLDQPVPDGCLYHINAILPGDIALRRLFQVPEGAHCRFDAISREYGYYIYREKNPFMADRAYFFPYKLDIETLKAAAEVVSYHTDFTSFSKRNTQVNNFLCSIKQSEWREEEQLLVYRVQSNRFLRGMVRGLVGTMLRAGRGKLSIPDFEKLIQSRDCSKADFSVPGHGLFLIRVNFPDSFSGDGF